MQNLLGLSLSHSLSDHYESFPDWVLTTRICSGLKRCDGQVRRLWQGGEKQNRIFSFGLRLRPGRSWEHNPAERAAGEIDPITSAEGKVSILNDSLTTNKGRTLLGPQPLRAQFVLTLATAEARQWQGIYQAAKQLSYFTTSYSSYLFTLSYIFSVYRKICWLSSWWQV